MNSSLNSSLKDNDLNNLNGRKKYGKYLNFEEDPKLFFIKLKALEKLRRAKRAVCEVGPFNVVFE